MSWLPPPQTGLKRLNREALFSAFELVRLVDLSTWWWTQLHFSIHLLEYHFFIARAMHFNPNCEAVKWLLVGILSEHLETLCAYVHVDHPVRASAGADGASARRCRFTPPRVPVLVQRRLNLHLNLAGRSTSRCNFEPDCLRTDTGRLSFRARCPHCDFQLSRGCVRQPDVQSATRQGGNSSRYDRSAE